MKLFTNYYRSMIHGNKKEDFFLRKNPSRYLNSLRAGLVKQRNVTFPWFFKSQPIPFYKSLGFYHSSNTELFLVYVFLYSVRIQKNADQK